MNSKTIRVPARSRRFNVLQKLGFATLSATSLLAASSLRAQQAYTDSGATNLFSTSLTPTITGDTSAANGDSLTFNNTADSTQTDDLTAALNFNVLTFGNTGALTLNQGAGTTLTLGSTAGGTAPTVNLNNTGTVTNNLNTVLANNTTFAGTGSATFGGTVSGAGSLTMSGTGTLSLGAANTYAGGTNLNAGILNIDNTNALGTAGTISFGGGTLQYGTGITTDFSNRFTSATGQAYNINIGANNVNQGSSLGGAGNSFTKSGAGTLTITTQNSFTGNYTVNGGTVQTGVQGNNGGNTAFGSHAAAGRTVTINNGGAVLFTNNNVFGNGQGAAANIATFVVNAGGTLNSTRYNVLGNVTLNGGTLTQNASDGNGNGDYQAYQFLGGITVGGTAASTISAGSNNAGDHLAANTTFNVASTGVTGPDLVVSARLVNQSGDFGKGNGGLTKSGAGTMALTAANIYNGATTISGGTLVLGNGGATGTLSTNSAIVNNAAGGVFAVNRSNAVLQGTDFSGAALTGAGGFSQLGTGTTTLNAANTFTGATLVNAGTLNLTGSLTSAVTVNAGGTLSGFGNGATTGRTTGGLTVAGGGAVTLAAANSATPLTVGGALTLGGAGSYGAGQFSTLSFTLGSGVEALNASGALTLNLGGAYVNLIGATAVGTYNLLTYSSQTGPGSFSLSSTTAGVTTANIGRNTYTLLDNATSLQLQVNGAAVPGVAYFNGAVSSKFNDLSSATLVNFSTNLAGTTDAGNVPGVTTDVILNASNAPAARTASETLGASLTINSLNVNGNGTTTLAADGSTLTINALADGNTASDGSYTGNTAGTGISLAAAANAFTVNVPVALGNSQSWTNNSASLFTVGGTAVTGTATTGNTQTLTLANTGAGGTTVSAVIGDGSLGGTLNLTINNTGAGTTILTANNTYTGGTTITAGTLQLNGTGVLGTGNIVDNGTLVFNTTTAQTINNVISGSGAVTLSGTGTLTLNANDTFSGGLAINNGTTLNVNDNAGNLGAGTVTVGSTVGGSATVNFAGNNTITYANNFVFNGGTVNSDDGDVHLGNATSTIAVNGATTIGRRYGHGDTRKKLSFDGILTGSGTLTLNDIDNPFSEGGGLLIGNNANTYSGAITVNSTTGQGMSLIVGGSTALQFASVNVQGNGTGDVPYGLRFNPGVTTPVLGALQGNGRVLLQDLSGAAIVLSVGNNNASNLYSGVLSGTGGFTKVGTGVQTLTGANTYTGATNVNAGTLLINGNSAGANGAVTVSSGSTLGGNGNLGGAAAISGTVAPGAAANTIGALTLSSTSGATIGGTGIYLVDLNDTTSDRLTLSGALTIASGATLTFNTLATPTAASYALANYTSETGMFTVTNLPAGYTLSYGATELDLVVAVPEPATWGAGLLSLGVFGYRVRRRLFGFMNGRRKAA